MSVSPPPTKEVPRVGDLPQLWAPGKRSQLDVCNSCSWVRRKGLWYFLQVFLDMSFVEKSAEVVHWKLIYSLNNTQSMYIF